MCGINGFIVKKGPAVHAQNWLRKANTIIRHRGPDGDGFALFSSSGYSIFYDQIKPKQTHSFSFIPQKPFEISTEHYSVGFSHRRLAIIDTSAAGHQPMCDTSQRYWITYNGELYNYIEIRNDLIALGYCFYTQSDTEVILQAFAHWNIQALNRFKGMFAFALYDTEHACVYFCRDGLGVKPLYYLNTPETLYFSSEQKTFTQCGLIPACAHPDAQQHFLLNGEPETPQCNFFEQVTEHTPGTITMFHLNTNTTNTITFFNIYNIQAPVAQSYANVINETRKKVELSIVQHMRSDVAVGTCLSGGLDSSIILNVMAKHHPNPLHCFTARFSGSAADEWNYAQAAAKSLHVHAIAVEPQHDAFNRDLNAMLYALDAPIWDTSTYAQFRVMQSAQIHGIKVVLDGQGADELYAGYDHYFISYWRNLISNFKVFEAFKHLQNSNKSIPQPFTLLFKDFIKRHFLLHTAQRYLKSDYLASCKSNIHDHVSVLASQKHDLTQQRLFSFLRCEDRCSMWHSVESRTPFSDDPDLITHALQIPDEAKFRFGIRKSVLRDAFADLIPSSIYNRTDKKGFETPFETWFDLNWNSWKTELIDRRFDCVNPLQLERVKPQSQREKRMLFRLFILKRWEDTHRTTWT
jgi:asparagine synthase (glutamine-hydrolysing)